MIAKTHHTKNAQTPRNNLATTATFLPGDLQDRIEQAQHEARGTRSANTEKTYAAGILNFVAWCDETGRTYGWPETPVDPTDLAAFVDARAETLKPATVGKYINAINAMHFDADMDEPGKARVVIQALTRMRRAKGTAQKQARPLSFEDIKAACKPLGDSLPELRDKALMWLAYDTLCRASELVAFNCDDIRSGHVKGEPEHKIFLARSKTDQEGKGQWRVVSIDTFAALRDWMQAARLGGNDALFIPFSRGAKHDRLKAREVSRIFKRRIGQDFTAHSTRVGAAIDLLHGGYDTIHIMQAGGWKGADMVSHYTAAAKTGMGAMADLARKQGRMGNSTYNF